MKKGSNILLLGNVDRKREGFDEVIRSHKLETFEVIDVDENDPEIPVAIKLNGRKVWIFATEFIELQLEDF